MKHILLVGAWPELVGQLVGLPARVTLLQLPDAAHGHAPALPFRSVRVDYRDVDAALAAARAVDRVDPLNAVVGLREFALAATAAIARALRLPCVPGPVESLGRDKADVRRLLADGSCRPVRFEVCRTAEEVCDFVKRVAASVVVKPLNGAGSIGVHAVVDPDEGAAAYRHACGASAGSGAVLVEELLAGPEFSVEVRSADGVHEVVAVTEKRTTGAPHFVETGYVIPARLTPHDAAALAAEATRALHAIGHRDGPSHVELINTAGGPAVVEVNRRIGGDRIWELLMLAADRNLMLETLRAVAALPTQPRTPAPRAAEPPAQSAAAPPAPRAAAIRYLAVDPADLANLAEPPGVDTLADVDGIVRWELTAELARQRPATSSLDRLGYVLAVAGTPDGAADAADGAHDRLARLLAAPRATSG